MVINNSAKKSYPTCKSCKSKVHTVFQKGNCRNCLTHEFSELSKRLENSRILGYIDISKEKLAITPANLEEIYELLPG